MKNLTKLLIIIIANCTLLLFNCDAANRFWIAGSTGDWNNTANWSTSSGGSGGASVPGSSDVAKFDGNGTGNCTINATVNVAGIDIGSGYSGTISQGSYVVTVGSSHFNVAGGTFTGGSVKIDINGGNFTLSGGTFTSTADTLFIGGFICGTVTQFNHSGGTFSHNNGTVVFDGTGCWPTTQVVNVITGTLFYNLVVNSNGLPVNTATSDTVKADNNFAHLAGKLGGNCWSVKGNLSVGTNANGGLAKLILWGTNSQTYAYSSGRTACVELNKSSGTVSAANGTTSFAVQSFKIISGTFTAPTGDFFIGGSLCGTYTVFTQSGGTFTHNNGRVVIDPTGCWPSGYVMDVNTSTVFYNVKINTGGYNCNTASGDTVKADNNLEVTSGVLNSGCYSIKGNLVIENSSSGGAGQVIFTGSNNQTYSCATGRACAVTVNKTGGSVSAASGTTTFATQGFKLLAGSFTAPTGNFKIGGAYCGNMYFTHSGGTFAHNNGNLLFDPNGCWHSWLYVDVIPSTRFYNCTHNSNVSIVLTNGDSLHIENELALTTGYEIYNGLFAAEGKVSVGSGAGNITTPLLFCGSGDQDFSLTGGTDKFNGNIKINKPSGKVNLLSACVLDASGQSLTLVKGNIVTTATNLLALGDNVTVTGASNDSYVDGVVKKTGNDAFTFPVGKNGHYRKIGISAPAVTTDAYTAEYFEQNSNDTYSHSAKDGTLAELSRNEYWNLARTTGTSNVSVTLSIDSATSCSVDNLSNLKVAAWDGSTWKDKGNGGTSGNVYVGTVVTNGASNVYGSYTIGTSTTMECLCDHVVADAGDDGSIFQGDSIEIGTTGSAGVTYSWTPLIGLNNASISKTLASPDTTTTYILNASKNGCSNAIDTVIITTIIDTLFPGYALPFALLAGGDIISQDTILAIGKIGALDSVIIDKVYCIDSIYSDSNIAVINALNDFQNAIIALNGLRGNSISNNLNGQTIDAGVYEISGNANLDSTLTLNGDSTSMFIINISGSLHVHSESFVKFGRVAVKNIIWNVGSDIQLDSNIRFPGIILSGGSINTERNNVGAVTLMAKEDIHVRNEMYLFLNHYYSRQIANINFSSESCGIDDISDVTASGECDDIENYLPNNNTPIRRYRVNFRIIQMTGNSPNNFQNTPQHISFLMSFVDFANNRLANLIEPTDPSCGGQMYSAIQYSLTQNDIYFVQDNTGNACGCSNNTNYLINNLCYKSEHEINVFFTEQNDDGHSGCGWGGSGILNWAILQRKFTKYQDFLNNPNVQIAWLVEEYGKLLIHEIMHTTGCSHQGHLCNNICTNSGGSQDNMIPHALKIIHEDLFGLDAVNYLECDNPNITTTILNGENILWDIGRIERGDVVVESGGKLTITCTVAFPPRAKLIVKPGGKLIIDGGRLMSSCGSEWLGVEVWGNPQLSQGNITTPQQGVLIMKNGAQIWEAAVAVRLDAILGGGSAGYTGGIIQATDAIFKNNSKSVAFMKYTKAPSISFFERCYFLCDKPFWSNINKNDNPAPPRKTGLNAFVSIWDVRGIRFIDNTFENAIDYGWHCSPSSFDEDIRGTGIASIDALYTVTATDAANGDQNKFIGLTQGIIAGKTLTGMRRIYVKESLFDNTQMGIRSERGRYDRIYDNTFNIPEQTQFLLPSPANYGIYLYDAQGYHIRGNSFTGMTTGNQWGSIIRGLKQSGGREEFNTFADLSIGSQTEVWNPYLKIFCNDYTSTSRAWAVNPQSPNGILGNQGTGCFTSQYRAGNNFFDTGNHIWNWAQSWVYYSSGATSQVPNFINSPPYIASLANCFTGLGDESCIPSDGPIIGLEKSKKSNLEDELTLKSLEHDSIYNALDSMLTDTLIAHLSDTLYSRTTLRNELLNHSLLSDTVLKLMLWRKPLFTDEQVLDVILANSPVSQEVGNYLYPKLDSLKAGYGDSILSVQSADYPRTLTVIKRETDVLQSDWFDAVENIIYLYSEADSTGELLSYLNDSLGTKDYKKLAIGLALESDSIIIARSMLDSLTLENEADTAFYEYYDLATELAEDSLTWFDMDSLQRVKINEIAESSYEENTLAQGVIALVDDTLFFRIPEALPDSSGKWDENETPPQQNQTIAPANEQVQIYPNPFSNSFTVSYTLAKEALLVETEVYDVLGRTVAKYTDNNISAKTRQINIGTCNGIYLCRVKADGKVIHQSKQVCMGQ